MLNPHASWKDVAYEAIDVAHTSARECWQAFRLMTEADRAKAPITAEQAVAMARDIVHHGSTDVIPGLF